MERIKQALERARQEREAVLPGQAAAGAAPRGRQAPPPPGEAKIVYTQTQVLPVPEQRFRDRRVIAAFHDDAISDAYKVLRTAVLQRMRANKWTSLAVTSPADGAGKTLTAVNLAISLASEVNHSVLLADLDLRRPRVHTYFMDGRVPGISEYLTDGVALSDILFNPGIERLVVLPGHKPFANSSEMLSSPRMVQLAKELSTRYPERIVIYDMPPVLACDDVMAFSPHVDAVLLVVEEGGTGREELRRATELLGELNVIGTVLNKAEGDSSAYGYY